MFVRARRVVVALAVVAAVLGALGIHPDAGSPAQRDLPTGPASASLLDASIEDAGAAVARMSSTFDIESIRWVGSTKTRIAGQAVAVTAVSIGVGICWWAGRRRDRRFRVPLRWSSLTALRAPPALV